ncbi:nucleoside triphosphate pyrophosphohydrolase family protein [Serratia marcescens]
MILTTTEELKHLASNDNTNELTRRLARECLANREAQPVALDVIARFKEWNTGFPVEKFKADYVIGWVLANYYAPPAPAVPPIDYEKEMIFFAGRGSSLRVGRGYYTAPPAPAYPERLPCPVHLLPGLKFGKGVPTSSMLDALVRRAEYESEIDAMTPEQRAENDTRLEKLKALIPPPAPAVPDDYFGELVKKARSAADKAMRKFPQPNYVLNKVAEESGEVIKAVIHYTEGREEWANVEGEIIDNLAMLIRLVVEGDQVIGFIPPDSCRAAMLKGEKS